MLRMDDQIAKTRTEERSWRIANLPPGPVDAPHADDLSFAEREIDRRALEIRIPVVFPLQVCRVQSNIMAPQIPLELYDLILEFGFVLNYLIAHLKRYHC